MHDDQLVALIERSSAEGGGWLDADTATVAASYDAALLAAGAGLAAVDALDAGDGRQRVLRRPAAWPPRHPAPGDGVLPLQQRGRHRRRARRARGAGADRRLRRPPRQRHPGRVLGRRPGRLRQLPPVPALPGHRAACARSGEGAGRGTTINLPLPAGATGDAFRAGVDEVLAPFAAAFEPTWLLISAGFDAHRADPITDLGLSAGDYADLTAALLALVPPGRRIVFLEGGYDLEALAASAAACVGALVGERIVPEARPAAAPAATPSPRRPSSDRAARSDARSGRRLARCRWPDGTS